jgi:type IV pilus biogenesis protein PilP
MLKIFHHKFLMMMIFSLCMAVSHSISAQDSLVDESLPAITEEGADWMADVDIPKDLCPEPKAAMQNTPDDLSKIQSDITRYTLCVQRAQLLQRLNDLTVENIDTLDSAISEMAATSFPEIDLKEIQDMFAQNFAYDTPMTNTQSADNNPSEGMPSFVQQNEWRIKDISGSAGGLVATLFNTNQDVVKVKTGETLPNSSLKVKEIQPTSVVIIKDKQNVNLRWLN